LVNDSTNILYLSTIYWLTSLYT